MTDMTLAVSQYVNILQKQKQETTHCNFTKSKCPLNMV